MPAVALDTLREYLLRQGIAGVESSSTLTPEDADPERQRWLLSSSAGRLRVTCYVPAAAERAARERAGHAVAGQVGLAAEMLFAGEHGPFDGGPLLVTQHVDGITLGGHALDEAEADAWLFLLLTLHHLPSTATEVRSSMSADVATLWKRTQHAWDACRRAYQGSERAQPLLDLLAKLSAIASVRVEVNGELWRMVRPRPCHGNPIPTHVVRAGSRQLFVEWDGFGLGDPAIEVARAATLAVLAGELTPERREQLLADYLAGTRDLGDATLGQRIDVVGSVVPLGFCFSALALLAESSFPASQRGALLSQVRAALTWSSQLLGVEIGDVDAALAPVHGA